MEVGDRDRPVTDNSAAPARAVSLSLLGLPALPLALAITTVSVLVPLTLSKLTSSSMLIGAVVAGEGLLALLLPLWVGPLSDRTHTALGGRLPYVIAGTALCALALVVLPFATSLWVIAAWVMLFNLGYFVCYPAYRALYPDLVPQLRFARSQGIQTLFREIGLALALTASPVLFVLWTPLPYLACAALLLALSAFFVVKLAKRTRVAEATSDDRAKKARIWPSRGAWRILFANSLWEFVLASLKSFVVLYVVVGTGRSAVAASGLMAVVAVVAVIAAPVAGHLGERFGTVRIMRVALIAYALGMFLPCFTQSLFVLVPAMPLVGFGGAVAMTLPFALLAEHLDEQSHGASAGWYEFSRGLGVSLGPVFTGAAIDALKPWFASTQGYAAMWLVQGLVLLVSIPLLPGSRSRVHPVLVPEGAYQRATAGRSATP
jgi:MFS family permease